MTSDSSEQSEQGVVRWKQKYYDALDDLESQEKQWQKTEQLLRQALSRFSLLADDSSPGMGR